MKEIIENISTYANTYGVDLKVFTIIYISSIVPIYLGAFMIIINTYKNYHNKNLYTLIQLLKKPTIKYGSLNTITFWGLVLHIFGWTMPYLYLIVFGNKINILFKLLIIALTLAGLYKLITKICKKY